MPSISTLQQPYFNQRQSIIDTVEKEENICRKENYGYFVASVIIGMLLVSIPFSIILVSYIKDSRE